MNKQALRLKYHPAKKEIMFELDNSGKLTPISGSGPSVLAKYINEKGRFILQDHGKQFFNDILQVFDGQRNVSLEVITTKVDFEDFEQMVEFFNQTSDQKITATLLAELPDMDAAYEAVKKHGLDSIDILNTKRTQFYDVPTDNENVKKSIDSFAEQINEATKKIQEKIDTLKDSTVNICFSGPYSSGKSLLIDCLIGYDILPTDIRPETAAMFIIRSPKDGDHVKVIFHLAHAKESLCEIFWNEKNSRFDFAAGPNENLTRKEIQEVMNQSAGKKCHEQLRDILEKLNKEDTSVERDIQVYFPISIDSEKVQFVIYDTPGTDSGESAHREILKEALSEQTHSILVFVTYPNGLSGGGNRALLEYLSEIDQKVEKSTIDLGRSLFVINRADGITSIEDFDKLRKGSISNQQSTENNQNVEKIKPITISLNDKKVLFTSAWYGYLATALKNGFASEDNKDDAEDDARKVTGDRRGKYYRHDRCASSEFATNFLIKRSDEAYEHAENNQDLAQRLWVASGMYALQSEICSYGEKYASAVKTFSIIDSVDGALSKLNNNATAIERQNSEDIATVENEIKTIRDTITAGISSAKKGREIKPNDKMPDWLQQELGVRAEDITQFVQAPAVQKISDILLGSWQKFKRWLMGSKYDAPKETDWDESYEGQIGSIISEVLSDYTKSFKSKRLRQLEKLRDGFIADVRKSIMDNGEISEEAKKYIVEIDVPVIDEFIDTNSFERIYRAKKRVKKGLIWDREYLDFEGFIRDLKVKLNTVAGQQVDEFKTDYRNSLNNILSKVESEFTKNMHRYSVTLKAKLEDKDAMEKLREKILSAVDELRGCQEKLDSVIWETK